MNTQHTVTVNAGNGQIKSFKVPAAKWQEMVDYAAREAKANDLAVVITVTSERRGVIYSGVAA